MIPIVLISYLIGSIPFGLCFCKIWGYGDIRHIGSGNIGATNVLRTGNKLLAILTLICDTGKGAFVVIGVSMLSQDIHTAVLAGVSTVIGHNFPIWLKFKGGKGIATSLGTAIAIDLTIGFIALIAWCIGAGLSRISAIGGLVSLVSMPISAYFVFNDMGITLLFLVLSIMAILKHKHNITRILKGTESKISLRKKS